MLKYSVIFLVILHYIWKSVNPITNKRKFISKFDMSNRIPAKYILDYIYDTYYRVKIYMNGCGNWEVLMDEWG